MSENKAKKKMKDSLFDLVPSPSYILVQCVMFFLHYGLDYKMPRFVVWFPTIVYGIIFLIVLFIGLIMIFIEVIK